MVKYALTVILAGLVACSDADRRGITPGSRAPDIRGISLGGEPLALSDFKGKVILVNFWASWCPPCVAELPGLEQLHRAMQSQGVQVVGVAVEDTVDSIAAITAQFQITFPIIVDTSASSKRAFEIKGLPESFVLDAQHRVMIVIDPEDKTPVSRIVGPRAWGEAGVVKLFTDLIASQPTQ